MSKKGNKIMSLLLSLALLGGGVAVGASVATVVTNKRIESEKNSAFDQGFEEGKISVGYTEEEMREAIDKARQEGYNQGLAEGKDQEAKFDLFDSIENGEYGVLKISNERLLIAIKEEPKSSSSSLYSFDKNVGLKLVANSGVDEGCIGYNIDPHWAIYNGDYKIFSNGNVLIDRGGYTDGGSLCLYKYETDELTRLETGHTAMSYKWDLTDDIVLISPRYVTNVNDPTDSCIVNGKTQECKTINNVCNLIKISQSGDKVLFYGDIIKEGKLEKKSFFVCDLKKDLEISQVESELFNSMNKVEKSVVTANRDVLFSMEGSNRYCLALYTFETGQFSRITEDGKGEIVALYETKNGKVIITEFNGPSVNTSNIHVFDINSKSLDSHEQLLSVYELDTFVEDETGVTIGSSHPTTRKFRYDFDSGEVTEVR